ncbi:hypothetical protein NZ47_03465 [Anaerovibrio lipolyticus]|uniref:Gfo/Idh/MocA-like oxidoreductase N-terminal domain-containing protein n=1 Tax=Anaerovibrio lipolyticus TaxID=82374 RepID=A0A0B2K1K0_9FIRM|nr:Gfo/Idh/MocA family oxidoreductase [Anaerovibrio lipolyticus]KHM52671.1 hypothetical protein NZ47_03465 [Anaerovibrio lipolyticus]
MKKNVLLIAVGGIGFRHFQAVINCKEPINLYVVDISEEALSRAREYAETVDTKPDIVYSKDISDIPEHIHVAIIATSSLPRRKVFEDLVANHTVDNVIFEKIMFPKLEDYEAVQKILEEKNIRAHVDCPARLFDVYHRIREESKECKYFTAIMRGSNWGLACNAIHLVDQVAFMAGVDTKKIVCSGDLEDDIVASKRNGYVEFFGKIIGNIGDKCTFVIECDRKDNPLSFEFFTDKAYYYVNEGEGVFKKVINGAQDSIMVEKIKIPFVSQLTNISVDGLLRGEAIDLASYAETRPLHEALLKTFLSHMNKVQGTESELCPIT